MKFSVCVDALYAGEDFSEALREIKKSGLSAFEFWSWWDKDIEAIAATAEELELQVSAFCTKMIPLTDRNCHDEFLSGLQESIVTAKKLNCSTLIAQIGPNLEEISREEQMENVANGLKRCIPELEKAKITLVYEPLNTKVDHQGYFLSTTEDAVRIHDAVKSQWVKILFDFYHQQISEGNVIQNSVNNLEKIGHFHAAGNPGRNELYLGEMNYPGILAELEKNGYQGFVGLEYFPKEERFAELCRLSDFEKNE